MKIGLMAEPTFDAQVPIHVPGKAEPVKVRFTFKHRDRKELDKFTHDPKTKELSDVQYILAIASGWELAEEFNKKNVEIFTTQRHTATAVIIATYFSELLGNNKEQLEARAKNS